MTTTDTFPTPTLIGKSVHLIDGAALLSLYNDAHPDDVRTAFDDTVQSWTKTTAKGAGWTDVEIIDDQVIFKAKPPKAAPVAEKVSSRATTGSRELDFAARQGAGQYQRHH